MTNRLLFIGAAAALALPASGSAHVVAQTHFLETAKPYAPYEFLIGDWYSKLAGSDMIVHQQFKWGPGKSYIVYASYLVLPGRPEQLHFEGMMVWNGKSKALDFLFTVQPGSGAQEQGTIAVKPDGSILRDGEMTTSDGDRDHFRQTFDKLPGGKVMTRLMEETAKGWELSPPGEIVMAKENPAGGPVSAGAGSN